ncbi:MAG TPA: DUF2975 domain-containing protein [Terricaulis sp.]|nr:DUF2975 domain-containing protein [Terricaulis sp.]
MTIAAAAPLARAQKLAAASQVIAIIAAIMLSVSAAVDVFLPPLTRLGGLEPGWAGTFALINLIGARAILAAPVIILASVCLDLRKVLSDYAEGRFFTLRAAKGVRKTGEGVLWAMAFKCVISPTLYGLVAEGARGGPPEVRIESFDLGLIALGFFIMMIGRVLEAAAAIKAENDEIV